MSSYTFVYKKNDKLFQCDFKDVNCNSITSSGDKCLNSTVWGINFCKYHLNEILKLEIKGSKYLDDEQGVFAKSRSYIYNNTPVFTKDSLIVVCGGEILTKNQLNDRYGIGDEYVAPYVWEINDNMFIDNACHRSVISYINSDYGIKPGNAIVKINNDKLYLYATEDIYNNTEILISYGDDYFDERRNVSCHYTIKNKNA